MKDRNSIAERATDAPGDQGFERQHSARRREFLTRMPSVAAVALATAAVPLGPLAEAGTGANESPDGSVADRVRDSYENREEAAREESKLPLPRQITNGDEQRYAKNNYI